MSADGEQKRERKTKSINEIIAASNEKRRARRRRDGPQPWIIQKLAVFLVCAIIVYTCYVYIGTFCVPMLHRSGSALGSRATGIAFLVVFCILSVMIIWSYYKIVFIPPGFARDHVEKTECPGPTAPPTWVGPTPYQPPPNENATSITHDPNVQSPATEGAARIRDAAVDDTNTGVTDALRPSVPGWGAPNVETARVSPDSQRPLTRADSPPGHGQQSASSQPLDRNGKPAYARRPLTTPVLLPQHRYCMKDGLVKPYRTHHCRVCGTCVLKFDHHCPWIGQCVGARNHRFFILFVLWAFVFCTWTFATLLALNVRSGGDAGADTDPQHFVVVALAGLFGLFTAALLFSHVRLATRNLTTVESLDVHDHRALEREGLADLYPWWSLAAKGRAKREWDAEWGRIGKEGTLWWRGDRRTNLESVMGPRGLGWVLPLGGPVDMGLEYPVNPRFDAEGRWRRRSEWPAELR